MEEPSDSSVLVSRDLERNLFTFLLVLAGAAFGYALSCVLGGPTSDEGFHGPQIWHYYTGGTTHFDNITMPSTYHYIIGFIVRQIGYYHDYLLRLINLSVALILLPVFFLAVRRYQPTLAHWRTLQLFFAPLVFPYFFLIYTDLWALLFVTLCFYCSFNRYFGWAAMTGLMAVLIRQDAIIWVGLAYLWILTDGLHWRRPWPIKAALSNGLLLGGPMLLLFVAFVVFVIHNGGVALGDADAHQVHHYNINNLYVFLFCAWLLFLAPCIQQLPKIVRLLRHRPWVALLLLAGFVLYMGSVSNPHGYNNTLFSFFLHNGLLYLMNELLWFRALLYLPIAWMVLTLIVMDYPDQRCYWMLLIIPVAVIAHPLVEPRYYFPAYVLINLWRPALPPAAEVATLVGYIPLAGFIMYGSVTGWFFL